MRYYHSGDLAFYRGEGLLAALVRWWTKSPYAHVAVVLVVADQVQIIEADATDGIVVRHPGHPDLVVECGVGRWNSNVLKTALRPLGTRYGWLDAARAGLGLTPKHRGMYCVEYATLVLKAMDLDTKGALTPGQLADVMTKAPC